MSPGSPLPDHGLVVRCGAPPFPNNPLLGACGKHPDGPFGFSVQSGAEVTLEQLAVVCRNNQIGFTTVGAIRTMGYDVVPTAGPGQHATVVVPVDWTPDAAEELARLFQRAQNPARGNRP